MSWAHTCFNVFRGVNRNFHLWIRVLMENDTIKTSVQDQGCEYNLRSKNSPKTGKKLTPRPGTPIPKDFCSQPTSKKQKSQFGSSTGKDQRVRSPSGAKWAPKVKTIKDYLLAKSNSSVNTIHGHADINHDNLQESIVSAKGKVLPKQSTVNALASCFNKFNVNIDANARALNRTMADADQGGNQQTNCDINDKKMKDAEDVLTEEQSRSLDVQKHNEVRIVKTTCDRNINEEEMEEEAQSEDDLFEKLLNADPENTEMPATVDLKTVVKMFTTLRSDFAKMDHKINEIRNENPKQRVEELIANQKQTAEEVVGCQQQLDEYKVRTSILTGAVNRMSQVIQELQGKVERLENNNSRKMMMISGIYVSEKKGIRTKQLKSLFNDELFIDVDIEDSYMSGEMVPPNVIITFGKVEDKYKVYKNVYRVKDYVNKDGKKMFFKDYLPQQTQERRKAQKDMEKRVKEVDTEIDVKRTSKGLLIQEEVYTKDVDVPDPTDVLQMDETELAAVLNMKINKAKPRLHRDNIFTAYTLCTNDIKEVQKGYMHVKLANPSARHIVCAWYVPNSEKPYQECDFQDDDEHGVGRMIAELMISQQLSNRAIYIARHYTKKIGAERYDAYLDSAVAIVNQAPYNKTLQCSQYIEMPHDENDTPTHPAKRSNVFRVEGQKRADVRQRGRGRGRGVPRGRGGRGRGGTTIQYTPRSEKQIEAEKQAKQAFNFSAPQNVFGEKTSAKRLYSEVVSPNKSDETVD